MGRLFAFWAVGLIMGAAGFWLLSTPDQEPAPVPGVSFPCAEDEILARWPGHDVPVCVHWELVESTVRGEPYEGPGPRVPAE